MEHTEEHFIGKVAQKVIIEKDGKILVCRGIGDEVWEFPGGRLHAGETPTEGIVREIREELGLEIKDIKPIHIDLSFHTKSNTHNVFIVYKCTCDNVEMKVQADELEEHKWVSKSELKDLPMFDDCEAVKPHILMV